MNALIAWLADFFLLSTVLLGGVLLLVRRIDQPARRMALCRSTLAALALLAALCALPGWSVLHLIAETPTVESATAEPILNAAPLAAEPVPALPAEIFGQPTEVPAPLPPMSSPVVQPRREPIRWDVWAMGAYLAGCLLVVVWQFAGSVLARGMVRGTHAAPTHVEQLLSEVTQGAAATPKLLVSDRLQTPVALGLLRPTILLPRQAVEDGPEALRLVLAHEWAHIRGGDLRTLAALRLLAVPLWPQPLFWLLRRQVRRDQESLADAAASTQSTPTAYAEHLVAWARVAANQTAPRLASSVGLWENPSQLRRRVAMLLDERLTVLRSCSRRWRIGSITCLLLSSICLSLVTLVPGQTTQAENAVVNSGGESSPARGSEIPPVDDDKPPPGSPSNAKAQEEAQARQMTLIRKLHNNRQPNAIIGICLDERGTPLKGVSVEVYSHRLNEPVDAGDLVLSTESAANGEFRFADVVDIEKEFPEGIPKTGSYPADVKMLSVVGRLDNREVKLHRNVSPEIAKQGWVIAWTMPPAETLRGRVTDQHGRPVAGARVTAGFGHQ